MGSSKRKHEDPVETATDIPPTESKKKRRLSGDGSSAKPVKKDKKSKKERKSKSENAEFSEDVPAQDESMKDEAADVEQRVGEDKQDGVEEEERPRKKVKKSQKSNADSSTEAVANGSNDNTDSRGPANHRFIVFVGNLPYSATKSDIESHFAQIHPTSVRLVHEKHNPTKSRGIAFVEFSQVQHMKTCLKLFHHSTFTCQGKDRNGRPKTEERKINVELTAGGGGNKENRMQKIRRKNEKLEAERERRAVESAKAKAKAQKEKEDGKTGEEEDDGQAGIHPSRRNRIAGKS